MNKKEMIFEIINLYDENALLNIEINNLKSENAKLKSIKLNKEFNSTEYKLIEIAKELLLKNCLYSWHKVYVAYDEEKDTYTAEKYEKWIERKIKNENLPKNISFNEFVDYLDKELHEMYEKEKEEAIRNKKAEREENE